MPISGTYTSWLSPTKREPIECSPENSIFNTYILLLQFALFALLAVAFAAPNPKPQLIYSSGLDYVYPGAAVPSYVSPYSYDYAAAPVAPVAYSGVGGVVYGR